MDSSNLWVLLAIAFFNAVTAIAALMTKRDMGRLEKNTNSIVAQLIVSTRSAAHAAGMKEEKDNPS